MQVRWWSLVEQAAAEGLKACSWSLWLQAAPLAWRRERGQQQQVQVQRQRQQQQVHFAPTASCHREHLSTSLLHARGARARAQDCLSFSA